MHLFPDCYPCMLRQVLSLAKLTGMDDRQAKQLLDVTMQRLLVLSENDSPQRVILDMTDFVHTTFFGAVGPFDPYAELKERSNRIVMDYFDVLETSVVKAPSPMEMAVKLSAAGNIIDFGAKEHGSIDIVKEIRDIPSLRFSVYDYEPLVHVLEKARLLVYIGDNAGEIVFDRIFIRQMRRRFPDLRIVFATRDRPIINDVTVEDARSVGLDNEAEILSSGCGYPGLVLEETSDEFKQVFHDSDMIIAKGQGNYEGLSDIADNRLFCILRIKCERVADHIGAAVGALVLLQKIS